MSRNAIIDGFIWYLGLVIIITLHEFAHAWTASKFGDDTARSEGRVSVNPIVHIDPIGTVLLPFLMIFLSTVNSGLGRFIIGWGKPVPVNPNNLRNPGLHGVYVAMAGPAMNLLLAVGLVILARVFLLMGLESMVGVAIDIAVLSLYLCFFNLLPVPPLDGSHLLRYFTGISDEAYYNLSRFGIIIVIVLLQIPVIRQLLSTVTYGTLYAIAFVVGLK